MSGTERAMTDPVDALAQVLAEHRLRWIDASGVSSPCVCGAKLAASSFHQHVAEAVLASPVVVAADKVRALANEFRKVSDRLIDSEAAEQEPSVAAIGRGAGLAHAARRLRHLLSEPATDAASCGECGGDGVVVGAEHHPACTGDCRNCPVPVPEQCSCQRPATDAAPTGETQRASWGVTGHRADQVATPTGEAQYADAAGVTLAEVAENWRRNTASLREHIERTDAIAREVSLPEGEQR